MIEYDLTQASMLLDEAGWIDTDGDGIRDKEGHPLAFTLLSSDDPDRVAVAQLLSEQWRQMGISATVEVVGAGLGDRLARHEFQAALAEVLMTGDPDPYPLWHQSQIEAGQNYAGWNHEQASKLLEAARATTNRGLRSDFYFQFQEIFTQEVPALILFNPVYTYGVSRDIYDVQLSPMTNPGDRFRTITDWYVLTQRVFYSRSQFQEAVETPPENP